MDEQTDKVIPSCTTMSDSNPDQETPVVLNALTGLDSLLSITCYISTRTARTDVLNVFYVFSKDLWMTKCLLHSFSIDMFWQEISTMSSLFSMDITIDYLLSFCSLNTYELKKVVRVIYVPHKEVWTMAKPPYQCLWTSCSSNCHGVASQ